MKLQKIKNAFLVTLALALLSAAAVAVTYAYGSSVGSATNTFTNDPNITVNLSEVNWDNSTGLSGESTNNIASTTLGKDIAEKYYPNLTINKNPKLSNASATQGEYVAMTVEYQVKINSSTYTYPGYTEFASALATTTFDTANWEAKSDSNNTVFYYKGGSNNGELAANSSTEPLFSTVTINSTFTKSGSKYVITYYDSGTHKTAQVDDLPEFYIVLKGYAVSSKNVANLDAAKGALDTLIANS